MPLLPLNGINKPTPKQLYEYSRIATAEKLALVVTLFMTLTLAVLSSMNLNKNSTQQQTSNYESLLKRPNPPSPEMVQRAQPYRADTLQELEAVIRKPAKAIDV